MYRIAITRHFDAAHHLRRYPGKCKNPHGHRWLVNVVINGHDLDKLGMLVDFSELKEALNAIIDEFDHNDLNTTGRFTYKNPTAENIAKEIFDELEPWINFKRNSSDLSIFLESVRVFESPDCYAEYRK